LFCGKFVRLPYNPDSVNFCLPLSVFSAPSRPSFLRVAPVDFFLSSGDPPQGQASPSTEKSLIPVLFSARTQVQGLADDVDATEITALPFATGVLLVLLQDRLDLASRCISPRA
jgi:hypothetical protein